MKCTGPILIEFTTFFGKKINFFLNLTNNRKSVEAEVYRQ